MSNVTLAVGQVYADLDARNARSLKGGKVKYRSVEIVKLPTPSQKGVMRVIQAPMNPGSVGQLREFTRGKLAAHYALVRS